MLTDAEREEVVGIEAIGAKAAERKRRKEDRPSNFWFHYGMYRRALKFGRWQSFQAAWRLRWGKHRRTIK